MENSKEILRIGRIVNKMLDSGVAIQPYSLLHRDLNKAVSFRSYEIPETELDEVLFKIKIIKDALWTYCPEYEEQISVLDDIVKALKNEKA